jgi:hypothetical protein
MIVSDYFSSIFYSLFQFQSVRSIINFSIISATQSAYMFNYFQSFFTAALTSSTSLFSTGPIGTSLLTGTAIWANQSAAVRISSLDTVKWSVTDIAIQIKTLYIEEDDEITFSLCNERGRVPDLDNCLDSSIWKVELFLLNI